MRPRNMRARRHNFKYHYTEGSLYKRGAFLKYPQLSAAYFITAVICLVNVQVYHRLCVLPLESAPI